MHTCRICGNSNFVTTISIALSLFLLLSILWRMKVSSRESVKCRGCYDGGQLGLTADFGEVYTKSDHRPLRSLQEVYRLLVDQHNKVD